MAVAAQRQRTPHEAVVDVDGIVDALEVGKRRVELAIRREQRVALERWFVTGVFVIDPSVEMILPLNTLHRKGRAHAKREMRQLGVPAQSFAAIDPTLLPDWARRIMLRLVPALNLLAVRSEQEAISATFNGIAQRAIAARILQVPGARDAASQVVSTAFTSGLADVFEANADAFSGWQYSAVLDGATCEECDAHDGEEYATLADLYSTLPSFGPNESCFGGSRCRCRGVPIA